MVVDIIFWIYDKLTHNTTRWFTADDKIRGTYINHIGMGIAEVFSSCTPKVLQELEEIVDNRRKELFDPIEILMSFEKTPRITISRGFRTINTYYQ